MGARRRDDDAMIMNTMMMNTVSLYINTSYMNHTRMKLNYKLKLLYI
jgi:hypothetical protein